MSPQAGGRDLAVNAQHKGVLLNARDDVLVVIDPNGLEVGDAVAGVTAVTAIAPGHKMAVGHIVKGAPIRKFGHTFAVATHDIRPGEWVHIHNVTMPAPEDLKSTVNYLRRSKTEPTAAETFLGYSRSDGRVGTRNYLVVASSVNCSASVVKAVCRKFEDPRIRAELAARGIHGVVPLTHGAGCAQTIAGAGFDLLNRTIAGSLFHPNVVGGLIVGLGCEGTTAATILKMAEDLGLSREFPVDTIGIQQFGGTAAAVRAGCAAVERLLGDLGRFERRPTSVSKLCLGLNCGGSDAFSSITANPALGLASDRLIAGGGTVALAEIPECYGAEELLSQRAVSDAVVADLRRVFAWWNDYAARNGAEINNNLSPGNMAGGISTIVEKSLGAVAKAGTSPLTAVVGYAMPIRTAGLVLMNTPGFDPVSVTGLVAGGCAVIAFTTGRGSVYGCAIAPTLKIATNSELFRRMNDDMDFDAGRVISEEALEIVAADLYAEILATASGKPTKSEAQGLGWDEFVPWAVGETL